MSMRELKMVGETCAIGGCYILVSASLTPGQHWESHELFYFLVLFGGMYCMFQTVCITVIYLFLQIFAANQDCIQQVPHECRAFSLRQSNDSYAHVDDHTVVVGALYCRTFPLPNHGKS